MPPSKSKIASGRRLMLLCSAIGALAPAAVADTSATWDSTYNNWSSAADWSTNPYYPNNGTPAGTVYDATINGGEATLNVNVTINDLTTGASGAVTADADVTLTASQLNNSGGLYFIAGNVLNITGAAMSAGSLDVGGGNTATFSGNLTSSGNMYCGYGGAGEMTVDGTLDISGYLTVNSAGDLLNVKAFSNTGDLAIYTGATLNITGGVGVTDIPANSQIALEGGTFNVISNGVGTSALANLATIEGGLYLIGGGTYTFGPLINTNTFAIGDATEVTINGNISSSDNFYTGYSGGGNTINVNGTFTNTDSLTLTGQGDVVNLKAINNQGTVTVNAGTTLNLTGGGAGLTDIPANAEYIFYTNSFNVINNGVATSALANLATVEGQLYLLGQNTSILPSLTNSGNFNIGEGATASFSGNVTNSDIFLIGYGAGSNDVNIAGTLGNTGNVTVEGTGNVVNVKSLNNQSDFTLDAGSAFNITGGGPGLTDIPAGAEYVFSGADFNVINNGVATSALQHLATVEGDLYLISGTTFGFGPLTNTGYFAVGEATTLSITGSFTNSNQVYVGYGSGNDTVNISGTFTNTGTIDLQSTGDTLNVNALNNQGDLTVNSGTTLNITGGGAGLTDIPTLSQIVLYTNSFNVINDGVATSALANLSTVEGNLYLASGQTFTLGSITNSGQISIGAGTTVDVTGNLVNRDYISTGYDGSGSTINVSGNFTNTGNFTLLSTGDLANVNTLNNQGDLTVDPGATLNVNGGATTTYAPGNSINISGTLTSSGATVAEGKLMVYTGGELNLTGGTTTVAALSIATAGFVNVGGTLVINYVSPGSDPIAAIVSYLDAGYNGGKWNGADIISTPVANLDASQSQIIYSVGYSDSADGLDALPSGEIEILPTLAGDAKLEGNVVFGDFQVLAQYFGKTGTSWDEGNFTYGSSTDFGDFQLLAQDFGDNSSALTAGEWASMNSFAAQFGDQLVANSDGVGFSVIAVPEPAAISLIALGAAGLLSRRSRKSDKISRSWVSRSKPR